MFSVKRKGGKPAVIKVPVKESNIEMVVPIDQYDSKDFNLNEAGWVRNSIAQIARAQSIDEYNALASRLAEIRVSDGIPDNITDEQAFDLIKPRYAQSANEVQQFMELSHDVYMKRLNDAYKNAVPPVPKNDVPLEKSPSSEG